MKTENFVVNPPMVKSIINKMLQVERGVVSATDLYDLHTLRKHFNEQQLSQIIDNDIVMIVEKVFKGKAYREEYAGEFVFFVDLVEYRKAQKDGNHCAYDYLDIIDDVLEDAISNKKAFPSRHNKYSFNQNSHIAKYLAPKLKKGTYIPSKVVVYNTGDSPF